MSDLNNLNYIDKFLKYLGYEKEEESFKVCNANSVSNILNLVGQILEAYAAQVTYLESGPGSCSYIFG